MKETLSSRVLTNVLCGVVILMLGWAIQMIRTPDPDLAVLQSQVEGIRLDVVKLSGLFEDMRRGKINGWDE